MLITQQPKTNQNIGSLSNSLFKTTHKITQENTSLTLDLLQTLQENHNATMQQINSNELQSLTNNVHTKLATQMEHDHSQNTLNAALTANSLNESINDSTEILNNSVRNTKNDLKESLQVVNSAITRGAYEQKRVAYKEMSHERSQTLNNFEYIKKNIRNLKTKLTVHDQLEFTDIHDALYKNGLEDALVNKDIQIHQHKTNYDLMLTATQNASIQQDTITKSTERLDHQIQNAELEDLKRKGLLAQQIMDSELALIRRETAIISSIQKQTCKIKQQIELRASNSQNLVKKGTLNRLKDTLLTAEIDNVSFYPKPAHVCPN